MVGILNGLLHCSSLDSQFKTENAEEKIHDALKGVPYLSLSGHAPRLLPEERKGGRGEGSLQVRQNEQKF